MTMFKLTEYNEVQRAAYRAWAAALKTRDDALIAATHKAMRTADERFVAQVRAAQVKIAADREQLEAAGAFAA